MCVSILPVVYVPYVHTYTLRGQKRASGLLELKLQAFVSFYVGAGSAHL